MQQVLPVLTGILAGGMYQWMAAQAHAPPSRRPLRGGAKDGAEQCRSLGRTLGDWMTAPRRRRSRPTRSRSDGELLHYGPARSRSSRSRRPHRPWTEMMEKGRDMQMQYLASLQSIFERPGSERKSLERTKRSAERPHHGHHRSDRPRSEVRRLGAGMPLGASNQHPGRVVDERLGKRPFTSLRVRPISLSIWSSKSARCLISRRCLRALERSTSERANWPSAAFPGGSWWLMRTGSW